MRKPIKKKAPDFDQLKKEEAKAEWNKWQVEMDAKAVTNVYRRMFVRDVPCESTVTYSR